MSIVTHNWTGEESSSKELKAKKFISYETGIKKAEANLERRMKKR